MRFRLKKDLLNSLGLIMVLLFHGLCYIAVTDNKSGAVQFCPGFKQS